MTDEKPKTLAERARDAIRGAVGLSARADIIHRMSLSEIDAFAGQVRAAASSLNGAEHLLRRLAKQKKKSGAAGAVHETRK
jgi:hypothetical protein